MKDARPSGTRLRVAPKRSVALDLPPVEAIAGLPLEPLLGLIMQLAALQQASGARLAALLARRDEGPDRPLKVKEAADLLGMSVDWLYRHADDYSPIRNGRALRFSERVIRQRAGAMADTVDGKDRVI